MPSSRIPSLDGLRALSISFVLLGHFAYSAGFPIHRSWWTGAYAPYGVRIFFIISGFLITTLLIQERQRTGSIDLKQFYIRRAYRILPAAYFYLIVVTILFYSSLPYEYLVAAYTYLTSYAFRALGLAPSMVTFGEGAILLAWPFAMTLGVFLAPRLACFAIVAAPLLRLAFIMISPSSPWPRSVTRSFPA